MSLLVYLLQVKPLETPFAHRVEVFNEVTIVVLIYGLMMFTDFVDDPVTRYRIGWAYMAVNLANISFHVLYLAINTCILVK